MLHDFTRLPQDDLVRAARGLGLEVDSVDVAGWQLKLDARGQKALVAALYTAEWAYYAEHETTGWWFASPTGLAMLGLGPPPPVPELATVFKAQPDLSRLRGGGAGPGDAGAPVPPRHDQADRPGLRVPARPQRWPGSLLGLAPVRSFVRRLGSWSRCPPVADLLGTKSKVGGKVGIRWCSALVKPEGEEVLAAIREHPQLKGYLEPGPRPATCCSRPLSTPTTSSGGARTWASR